MIRRYVVAAAVISLLAALLPGGPAARGDEPDVVTVQHILVGIKGKLRSKPVERNKREARDLAEELYRRAVDGEDFDALVKEYTDDSYPGIYTMTNFDAPLMPRTFARDKMAPGFGHVSFGLAVGEIGLVKYHPANSPYGWHVVKRIE